MSRGGARAGAGRKGLDSFEKMLIGGECELRWQKLAEAEALERYEAMPRTKEIRKEQSSAGLIPAPKVDDKTGELTPASLRTRAGALKRIGEEIDDITGGERRVSILLRRPYAGRKQIITDVIGYLAESFGMTVTAGQVVESWKAWSEFKKSPDYQHFLKNPKSGGGE